MLDSKHPISTIQHPMKLFFRKYGSGPPLLILHGLFGSGDNWNTLAKKFGESGYTAVPVDLRNHGLSPHSEEWSYECMANDLSSLIKENTFGKVNIIGHSMGGKAAMEFCLSNPSLVDKMIIVDIAPKAYPGHHDEVITILQNAPLASFSSRKEAESYMLNCITDKTVAQFLLKNLYRMEDQQFAWRFNLPVISKNYAMVAGGIGGNPVQNQVLFLRGEKSPYIRDEDFESAKKLFPNVTLQTIPGSGHWIHAEKPDDFFNSVIRFLTA